MAHWYFKNCKDRKEPSQVTFQENCEDCGTEVQWIETDESYVLLPNELTAENGAKYLLNGEFSETEELTCVACDEDYKTHDGDNCDICMGTGHYISKTIVSWTTIKDIYKKIVEHYA